MHPPLDGCVEAPATPFRRRASTESINLDYQNTHPVDDDILSRIRSLLLSRNGHRPPMTPHTSEENPNRAPRDNTPTRFDFSSAKSIAKFARKSPDVIRPSLTRSLSKSADMAHDRRPSQPTRIPSVFERPLLRTSISVNDLRGPYDDDYKAKVMDSPSSSTHAKKSWFPKLVLRDIKPPETEQKSCLEISKYIPPNDLEIHRDEFACCPPCVPLEPGESKYSAPHTPWPGEALMAQPADLVCFLAGCPPGHLGCKKQHRIPSIASRHSSQGGSRDDARSRSRSRTTSSVRSSTKGRPSLADARVPNSRTFSLNGRKKNNLPPSNDSPKFTLAIDEVGDNTEEPNRKDVASPLPSSPRSSITSADKFPHAMQSLDEMANEGRPKPLSTSVATNFSFSGPRARLLKAKDTPNPPRRLSRALPGPTANSVPWKDLVAKPKSSDKSPEAIGTPPAGASDKNTMNIPEVIPIPSVERTKSISNKLSKASIRNARPQSPSLRSGASRTSAYWHLLLKPSVTEDQPVDMGLPITPILSTTVGSSEISMPPQRVLSAVPESPAAGKTPKEPDSNKSIEMNANKPQPDALIDLQSPDITETVNHKLDLQTIKAPVKATIPRPPKLLDISILHSFYHKEAHLHHHIRERSCEAKEKFQASLGNDGGNSTLENGSSAPDASPYVDPGVLKSPTASSHAAYWGFVPTVKNVVNDAVNLAVRSVVSEAVLPHGTNKDKAARAYRRAVAESLVEAAQDVDVYLRRPSVWKDPEPHDPHTRLLGPCFGTDCLHDPHIGIVHCNTLSCEAAPLPEPQPVKLHPSESDPLLPNKEMPKSELGLPNDVKIQIPPKSASKIIPEIGVKRRKASRKTSAAPVSGIPDRASSRQRTSILKAQGPKSKETPTKNTHISRSKKLSYDRLGSCSDHTVCSASTVEASRDDDKKDQQEELFLPHRREESEADSLSYLPSNERLGRKNTVHWLRDLLSSAGPYEPRLTALPPRTRRGQDSSATRMRSQTAPIMPVKQLFLGATTKPTTEIAIKSHSKVGQDQSSLIPEALSKTITELEELLNEALVITRRAADGNEPKVFSRVEPEEKKNVPKSQAARQSDEISLIGSVHESMRSFSGLSDGSYDTDENSQLQEYDQAQAIGITIVEKPALRELPSGWQPTGRVTTPYSPNTRDASFNSVAVDIGEVQDIKASSAGSKNSSIVRQIDPRLKSVGTNLRTIVQKSFSPPPREDEPIEFQNLEPFNGKRLKMNQKGIEAYSPGGMSPIKSPGESDLAISKSMRKSPIPLVVDRSGTISPVPLPKISPRHSKAAKAVCRRGHSEEDHNILRQRLTDNSVPTKREVRDYILENHQPPIHERESSKDRRNLAEQAPKQSGPENQTTYKSTATGKTYSLQNIDESKIIPCSHMLPEPFTQGRDLRSLELRRISQPYSHSFDGTQFTRSEEVDFDHGYSHQQRGEPGSKPVRTETAIIREREIELRDVPNPNLPVTTTRQKQHLFELKNKRHVSLREHSGFSLARSHKRQKVARDWSPGRKRFCAAVACLSTALVGILVGIYAGETPAIQYWIVDFHHYTVLGNVFFFIGLSIPTFVFWPLPLLHGRKPYILGAMSLAMPLLFPQALAVGELRSPYTHVWRVALIMPRAFMGFCLGFANMNFKGVLTDLFGASLQSTNPHQEHVDEFDVRRHGGGMGVWLGLWTWSAMGSIGVGFLIGAAIINHLNPAWGFYISITIIAFILLLNVLTPEVRRSAFRRSVAEVKNGDAVSRRLARGEVKMHLVQTGPKWWGEEFHYGLKLSAKMLRQPGFMVMAAYVAWMYGQIVLIVLLLGSLCSNTYKFQSPQVGLAVASVPLGAFVAIPFQKASLFSRDRNHAPKSDDDTYKKKVKWSSHFIRRAIFVLTLPFAGLGYTLSSGGAHIPFIIPILFAALIGFLSNLAMAECHGIIMETYDTSDLSPGMTGRSRGSSGGKTAAKRTNYSSFPRVASAFGITQGLGYLIGAIASGVGGTLTRNLGQQAATGVMAFILLILSVLLLGVLIRFKDVQIIPNSKKDEMDRYHNARRTSSTRRAEGIVEEEPWRPIIIGNPHHSTRRMCILELGSMSRFSEIRLKNRLIDEQSLEARHPNQQMMIDVRMKIKEKEVEIVDHVRRSLSRQSSRGSRRSTMFNDDERNTMPEQGDLGGHREIGRMRSETRAPKRRATGIRE